MNTEVYNNKLSNYTVGRRVQLFTSHWISFSDGKADGYCQYDYMTLHFRHIGALCGDCLPSKEGNEAQRDRSGNSNCDCTLKRDVVIIK